MTDTAIKNEMLFTGSKRCRGFLFCAECLRTRATL